jgi:hypothetical protein
MIGGIHPPSRRASQIVIPTEPLPIIARRPQAARQVQVRAGTADVFWHLIRKLAADHVTLAIPRESVRGI